MQRGEACFESEVGVDLGLRSISLIEYEENMLRLEDVQLKLERHVKEMD
jgi:hypothetical protein